MKAVKKEQIETARMIVDLVDIVVFHHLPFGISACRIKVRQNFQKIHSLWICLAYNLAYNIIAL